MSTPSNKDVFFGGFMKLFKEQWEVDVLLKAGESDGECEAISAHRFVLAAKSEVFKKMLESDSLKASVKLETITLSDMKHEEVEAFVEFMYNTDGSIPNETLKKHVESLYFAADKYEILHLRDVCRSHLISSLSASNALHILEIAQTPFDKVLNDAAFFVIKSNRCAIVNSAEFKLFVANHPILAVEIMKASFPPPAYGSQNSCNSCGRYY